MKQNTIAQYIFKLYSDSKYYGFLHDSCIKGDMWDEWIAKDVSLQCEALVGYLTDLAEYYNAPPDELPKLAKTQAKVWNTFLRPLRSTEWMWMRFGKFGRKRQSVLT